MAQAESNANREGILDENQGACTSPVPDLQSSGTLSNTNHTLDNNEQRHPSDMLPSHGDNGLAAIQQKSNVPGTGRSSSNQGEAWSDNDDANLGGYLMASKQRYGPAVDSFVVGGLSDDISMLTFDSKSDDDGGGSGGDGVGRVLRHSGCGGVGDGFCKGGICDWCRSAVVSCMLCHGGRGIGCVVVVVVMLIWY